MEAEVQLEVAVRLKGRGGFIMRAHHQPHLNQCGSSEISDIWCWTKPVSPAVRDKLKLPRARICDQPTSAACRTQNTLRNGDFPTIKNTVRFQSLLFAK